VIIRTVPLLALIVLHAGAAPAQQFEGVFMTKTLRLSSDVVTAQAGDDAARALDKMSTLTSDQLLRLGAEVDSQQTQVKGGRMRSAMGDMPGMGGGYIVIDVGTGMMRMVMPAQRSYTEISLRGAGRPPQGEEDEEELKVEPLGRTQVIGNLRCTGYRITEGDDVSIAWMTSDPAFKQLFEAYMQMAGDDDPSVGRARALLARYGYPVMTQRLDEDGDYRAEVWSLERRPMADSLFAIPPGFTRKTMPGG
jgi:hypothetical protein